MRKVTVYRMIDLRVRGLLMRVIWKIPIGLLSAVDPMGLVLPFYMAMIGR